MSTRKHVDHGSNGRRWGAVSGCCEAHPEDEDVRADHRQAPALRRARHAGSPIQCPFRLDGAVSPATRVSEKLTR
jgi:hypothetical protein